MVALTLATPRGVPAQTRLVSELKRTLDSIADTPRGIVGYTVTYLDTGEHVERRGDEPFATASLIKVPVLVTLFDLAAQLQLSLDDPVVLTDIDKVGAPISCSFCGPRSRCASGMRRGS